MGRIFGISELPVTIFTTPLEPVKVPEPIGIKLPRKILNENIMKRDLLSASQFKSKRTGFLNKLINGFRKVI